MEPAPPAFRTGVNLRGVHSRATTDDLITDPEILWDERAPASQAVRSAGQEARSAGERGRLSLAHGTRQPVRFQ